MLYEVEVEVRLTLRFEAMNHGRAEVELDDTLNKIKLMDGVTVTNVSHDL